MKKILITSILGMLFVMTCHCVYAATTDECINNTENEPRCKDCCDCLDDATERQSCRGNCQTHDFSLNSDFITVDVPSSLGPDGDYSAALVLNTESACKEYCDTSSELLCGDRRYCRDACNAKYTGDDPLIGDIDNSGDVDLKDAITALQICAGTSVQKTLNLNADVNSDDHLGMEEAIFAVKFTAGLVDEFTLSSIAISDGEISDSYKCETKVNGVEDSIPLSWSNVPDSTGSLAVIMHSYPNSDDTSVNSYLLLWDIDPSVTGIAHGEADDGSWFMGANKDGIAVSYTSPCSPGAGTHIYTITLYALSQTPPSLPDESTTDVDYSVLKAAIDTVTTLGTATLTFIDVTE
ncbi:MAG: hypothetical protein GY749_46440 [Desulfobacteraceae bacterium]|nr:hypothetical protein [Desulfobacteraceae bacterium]